ncbi:hypothetical protein NMG60_11014574 [Bertholletia excelsa]
MSIPAFSDDNLVNGFEFNDFISDHEFAYDPNPRNLASSSGTRSEEVKVSDAVLKHISQMLMEDEDSEYRLSVLKDSLAFQAAEKSLYDALGKEYPPSQDHNLPPTPEYADSPDDDSSRSCSSHSTESPTNAYNAVDSCWTSDQNKSGSSIPESHHVESNPQQLDSSSRIGDDFTWTVASLINSFQVLDPSKRSQALSLIKEGEAEVTRLLPNKDYLGQNDKSREQKSSGGSRGKKSHSRDDSDYLEGCPSNKQLASCSEAPKEPTDMFDKVLLCTDLDSHSHEGSACLFEVAPENGSGGKLQKNRPSKGSSGGRPRGKRKGNKKEVVDLMTLLSQFAQAVASNDSRVATEQLKQVRQHSSPHGNANERLAYYFANALEARLSGTGRALDASLVVKRLSAVDTLKAYRAYLTACPYKKIANFYANRLIRKLAWNATKVHIIDFGIIHGFQWPHIIQDLSLRPGGPPTVRITGIDFPQPGFRPTERLEETGHRLADYCDRFKVPFQYNAVAKKWDTIQLEDLKLERDEVLVVNCLYRLRYVPDETVAMNSPRDAVLRLIKMMNPTIFIHGIVNGAYNAPFFLTRFREALFQFALAFDMFDAVLPREDQGRMLYEREVLGRGAMSVIACEGTERIIRPETYKQWHVRNVRAGLRPLPLDQEIMESLRSKVKLGYHKDFMLDKDGDWMLHGWKGRIISALSCWKSVQGA